MVVFAPRICNERTVYSVFGQVFDEQGNLRSNRYAIDMENLAEVDLVGTTALVTLSRWLRRQSITMEIVKRRERASRTLKNLYRQLDAAEPESEAAEGSASDLTLRVLDPEHAVDWIADELLPWLSHELLVTSTIASSRARLLKELFSNASRHSYCRHVMTAARCDREQQEVVCVVADDGIGIPQAVRRVWNESIDDTLAIARSIEAGFSSIETGEHEGKGLSRLVEHVVHRCQGQVAIHSGFGVVKCRTGVSSFVTALERADAFFPGSLFVVSFPGASLGRIPLLNEPDAERRAYETSLQKTT